MPELPEVERVRLSLDKHVVGQIVKSVDVRRKSVITGSSKQADLMKGLTVKRVARHGKQLALIGGNQNGNEKAVCVQLGMTGAVLFIGAGEKYAFGGVGTGGVGTGGEKSGGDDKHVHVLWRFDDGSKMAFRDPRRFGGLRTFFSFDELKLSRWSKLGPDALLVKPSELWQKLQGTRRSAKAALLDQNLVAGLGNIYVDELLFGCGVDPRVSANEISIDTVRVMVRKMRVLLGKSIDAGGSSIRDYVDGEGKAGNFQSMHKVYGRGGQPCKHCGKQLETDQVGGRTTVWCGACQVNL